MNFVSFSVLQCFSLLLNIGASAALDQQEPPPAEVFEFGIPDNPDINENNLKYNRPNIIGMALGGGRAVMSADAEAYFVGQGIPNLCYTLTGVIACQFSGPVKVLLVYKDNEKFFDLEAGDNGVCYAGRRGVFCDDDEHIDLEDFLTPPVGDKSMAPGRGIYNIEIGPTKEYWRCMSGYRYELCTAIGPVHIDLTHDETSSAYDIGEDMHVLCYAGRLGSFCDVYEKASADK